MTVHAYLYAGSDVQYLTSIHGTWSGFSRCAFVVSSFYCSAVACSCCVAVYLCDRLRVEL